MRERYLIWLAQRALGKDLSWWDGLSPGERIDVIECVRLDLQREEAWRSAMLKAIWKAR